ncbi:MAG: tetratricopeptide repeat protein [bacterium]|nr:tetratricopeptide repeat protein [bacterium]
MTEGTSREITVLEAQLRHFSGTSRHDLAIDCARQILLQNPVHLMAHSVLILAYNNSRQYELMYEACCVAVSKWPRHPMLYYYLSLYHFAIGGTDHYLKARDVLQRAISLNPTIAILYRKLGELYLINREPERALLHLEKAVELEPKSAEYRSRMALALLRCRKKNQALEMARAALKDEPGNPNNLDTVGMILILVGELDEAEQLFLEALRLNPTFYYFLRHIDWCRQEITERKKRLDNGEKYTPLYLRQKGSKRYFDSDALEKR